MKWLTVFIFFISCTLIPNYRRPEIALAKQWDISKTSESVNKEWWSQLGDKVLDYYINEALKNNQNLKVAIARVDAFYAQVGIVRSELYPQLEVPMGASRIQQSKTLKQFIPQQPNLYNIYAIGIQGSLELDVWGRIRSASQEALAMLCSQVEVRRTVVLNLVTSVASTYITLRALDKQLKIAQNTVLARDQAYQIAKIRFELGLTSIMQVEQALSELDVAMVKADDIAIQVAFGENQINFLLGRAKGTIRRGKLIDNFCMPPQIPTDLPSHILTQRPDILAAEQLLIASNANIGVARAQFLPDFSLTGNTGFSSSALSNFISKNSNDWLYGLDVVQAIFTGGRLISNLDLAYAQKQEQIHNYLSTVLKACNQVNDALIDHKVSLAILETLKDRVQTVRAYFRTATLRYNEGETDYLNFLDAERQLFNTELEYAESQAKAYTTLVSVYAALGGGWVLKADDTAMSSNQKNCKQ